MITSKDITNSLYELGLRAGDTCLFHSSFKSLGEVDGGAGAVIKGFEDLLGENGTLAVPTLVSKDFFESYNNWHLDKPSETGYLTEYFRKCEGVLRSDQATHSVVARGRLAYELTFEHTARGPHLCPFGEYAFADSSPWLKLYNMNANIVFIGVTLKYNTLKHPVEARFAETLLSYVSDPVKKEQLKARLQSFENRWQGVWPYYHGEKMQAHLESLGLVSSTQCGNATLRMIKAKDASDAAFKEISENYTEWYQGEILDWILECISYK